MVAQGVLEALGYESDLAADGAAAVAMAAASSYDAIVMDLQMPAMDGYTATRDSSVPPRPAPPYVSRSSR